MQKSMTKLFIPIIVVSIIFSVIYLQTSSVYATGSVHEAGVSGFSLNEGDVLSYLVTKVDLVKGVEYTWAPILRVGDRFQTQITTCNNTYYEDIGTVADAVFGYYNFFDFSSFTWYEDIIGSGEFALAFYNNTHELNFTVSDILNNTVYFGSMGLYSFLFLDVPHMDIGVRNFTALNQSIVNITYTMSLAINDTLSFTHSEPEDSVVGTWVLSLGSYDDDYAFRFTYSFNSAGICTLNRMFFNGTSDWTLVYESKLENDQILSLIASSPFFLPQSNQNLKYILYAVFGVGLVIGLIDINRKQNIKGSKKGKPTKDIGSIRATLLAIVLLGLIIFSITDNLSQIAFGFIQQLLGI